VWTIKKNERRHEEMTYRVFTKKGCGTCKSVVSILKSKGLDFTEVDISTEAGLYLAQQLHIRSAGSIVDENDKIIPIADITKMSVCPA
jgi:glutaredoxin-related protein